MTADRCMDSLLGHAYMFRGENYYTLFVILRCEQVPEWYPMPDNE